MDVSPISKMRTLDMPLNEPATPQPEKSESRASHSPCSSPDLSTPSPAGPSLRVAPRLGTDCSVCSLEVQPREMDTGFGAAALDAAEASFEGHSGPHPLVQKEEGRFRYCSADEAHADACQRGAGLVRCTILRERRRGDGGWAYVLRREEDGATLLVARQARGRSRGKHFEICADALRPSTSLVASLVSNVAGTKYVAYHPGMQPWQVNQTQHRSSAQPGSAEVCVIRWETSLLSLSPQRRMNVVIPAGSFSDAGVVNTSPVTRNPLLDPPPAPSDASFRLKSKKPTWHPVSRTYTLDFGSRVTCTSTKNFQLEDENFEIRMACGRTGRDSFICDYKEPITAVTAFAIAISTFDFKLCFAI